MNSFFNFVSNLFITVAVSLGLMTSTPETVAITPQSNSSIVSTTTIHTAEQVNMPTKKQESKAATPKPVTGTATKVISANSEFGTKKVVSSEVTSKKTATPTSKAKTFSIIDFKTGLKIDRSSPEKQGPVTIHIAGFDQAPEKLSLCKTLLDENNVTLTETDCWPLKEYGTWKGYLHGDPYNLAPRSMFDYKSAIKTERNVKMRFELINSLTNDYSIDSIGHPRDRHPEFLIATDDTAIFKYWSSVAF